MKSSLALKILWGVVGLALAFVVVGLMSLLDYSHTGEDKARGAAFGFFLFASFLGVPGGIALTRARVKEKHQKLLAMLAAYVRSRDVISLTDVARAVGRTEIEVEALLLELIEIEKLDLVFHQSREEYLHRARIRDVHELVDTCTSCGARLKARVIFQGEQVSCEYCNVPIALKG